MAGRAAAGAGNGRGPQQAVWRGTAVLRRRWPPSTCQGAAPCGLRLFAGGGGWCCYGAATHAMLSVTACNRRPPSSTSSSTSGLSRPVLPRQLWRVVGWVGFLSGVERVHINIGTWGLCDRLCLVLVCRGRYGLGGFSSLVKQNKKGKKCAVFCFARKRKLFFYILRCDCEAKNL